VTDEGDWFDGVSGFQEEYLKFLLVIEVVRQRKKVRASAHVVGIER